MTHDADESAQQATLNQGTMAGEVASGVAVGVGTVFISEAFKGLRWLYNYVTSSPSEEERLRALAQAQDMAELDGPNVAAETTPPRLK
ncbi:hypothetical protein [Candidatus Berkiella aquae]|uniref:Uncharacterized protein n=1 Tax=Candidatus Berkiella aquae TaxID=295108 RepID=A0A0Q9YYR3_9GAMM|nr:hypothetical protein [Candidatus Berkiella aquae]MCS5710468.1 hypothetical protein [Candidatus Berkiella aquae]